MDQALALKTDKEPLFIVSTNGKRSGTRDWTSFGIALVLANYKNGRSIKEIANLCETTKNSIVGVINRARLRGELPPLERSPTRGIPKKVKPSLKLDPQSLRVIAMIKEVHKQRKLPPPEHKVRLRVINNTTEVTLLQLKFNSCRWPLGDPRLSDFRFCGKTRQVSCPYCPEHVIKGTRPSRGRGDY